jgi:hypothetical protein
MSKRVVREITEEDLFDLDEFVSKCCNTRERQTFECIIEKFLQTHEIV